MSDLDWGQPGSAIWSAWRPAYHSDADAIAHAVWLGNLLCKSRDYISRRIFYSIKDELIRRHATAGYPVRQEIQYCYTCGGLDTQADPEPCPTCRGSGVYRYRWLYAYKFQIEGQAYAYHSYRDPGTLINRDPTLALEPGGRFDQSDPAGIPWTGLLRLLCWIAENVWDMIQIPGGAYLPPAQPSPFEPSLTDSQITKALLSRRPAHVP